MCGREKIRGWKVKNMKELRGLGKEPKSEKSVCLFFGGICFTVQNMCGSLVMTTKNL